MAEEIRPVDPRNQGELEQYEQIIGQAFNIPQDRLERMRQTGSVHPDETLALFTGDRVMAGLMVHDMRIVVGGRQVPMGGVAAVACPPENRRKGATAKLLAAALSRMRQKGQVVSILYPFKFQFYRKYGWEMGSRWLRCSVKLNELSAFLPAQGSARRTDVSEWETFNRVYQRFTARRVGPLVRDKRAWEERVFSNPFDDKRRYLYLWYPDEYCEESEGYVVYTLENEGSERKIRVRELAYLTLRAYRGLWGLLANHDSQAEVVEVDLPLDDPLMFLIPNPRIEAKVAPSFMFRIVDLAKALQARPFGDVQLEFRIAVADRECPWNQGEFMVKLSGGQAAVTPAGPDSAGANTPLVKSSIQTLSQLYTGVLKPSQAVTLEKLTAEGASQKFWDQLDAAFGNLTPHLNDFF